ncbi:MAG: methyl-accepting chemotaxis protein [Desulfobacterales bacterium]|nr:methyl-accepting chemotaxis protein [Desulfobacterales bacterium]MCP4163366.1 methyl-accepting chemotaxis protein [Deltaproteobacteria bacterium]
MNGAKVDSQKLAIEYVPEMQIAAEIRGAANRIMYQMRGYGFTEEEHFYQKAQQEMKAFEKAAKKADALAERAVYLKKLKPQMAAINSVGDEYKKLMVKTKESIALLAKERKKLDFNAAKYMKNANTFLVAQNAAFKRDLVKLQNNKNVNLDERNRKINIINDIIDLGNDVRVRAFKSQALRDPEIMESGLENFPKIDENFIKIKRITRLTRDIEALDNIQQAGNNYKEAMMQFLIVWKQLQSLGNERNTAGGEVIKASKILQEAASTATQSISDNSATSLEFSSIVMIVGLIAAIILGVILAFLIVRGIVTALQRISGQLNEGAEQVASASGQVSNAGQSLAEGASEQAASIEETSSSLEEMSSMTKQNADNAVQANNLMKDANQVVEQANDSMTELTDSMEEISKASEETSKIIKTIDEIAFQTNLLALNAAVEAARAGEAGAGFAVVADEVRNLAMRAAEAAKNTADLIEGTVKKVGDGSELVSRTNENFSQVAESTKKVGELVGEISVASNEQADGIEQVNKAVAEMDKVVQQNAGNAEESASASEELTAQAQQAKALVSELMKLVNGSNNMENTVHSKIPISHGQTKNIAVQNPKHKIEIDPSRVIPMDDDFSDF